MKSVKCDFKLGDLNYKHSRTVSYPYDKRKIAGNVSIMPAFPQSFTLSKNAYRFSYFNQESAFEKRNLNLKRIHRELKSEVNYDFAKQLISNSKLLNFSLKKYLREAIKRIKKDPNKLKAISEELIRVCKKNSYPIPYMTAFEEIGDLESFLILLNSIQEHRGRFQFDLTLAAILQFAKQS